jgi:hypothetical protein
VQLVAAVWKLWQLGTLDDTAAEYEAAIMSAAAASSCDSGRTPVPAGQRLHMRTTADNIALSTDCSWTLPAVHFDSSGYSQASCDGSSLLLQHSGQHALPGSKAGGRRSTTACVLVGASASSSMCSSSACTSLSGSEGLPSHDGGAEGPYLSRYQLRQQQQQQQPSRLQQSTTAPALGVLCSSSSASGSSSCPAWEQVLQLQQQAEGLNAQEKEAQHGPSPAAEAVLQLLSLRRLSAGAVSATSRGDSSSTVVPSLYHLQLLSDAAVIGGLR